MLVKLVPGHCLKQQGICIVGHGLTLLDIGFFVGWDRSLVSSGSLDIYGGVLFTNQYFGITARPFANYLLLLEYAVSDFTKIERFLHFGLCRFILFSCR